MSSQSASEQWVNKFIQHYHLDEVPFLSEYCRKEVAKLSNSLPFKLISMADLLKSDYILKPLIKGVLNQNSLTTIYGPSGSMKTFVVLSMAYSIATGRDWYGNKVEQGNVIYLAGEGHYGLKSRLEALAVHFSEIADQLVISEVPARLSDDKNLQGVIYSINQVCKAPKLIIVDTLHRNMGEGDENSASDMAKIINNLDKVRNATGASIMLVHHTGHNATDRARGSSSIRAAMDNEYHVTLKDGLVTMKCTKAKDSKEPSPFVFEPVEIDTGSVDADGFPIMSLVLEVTSNKINALNDREKMALSLLIDLYDEVNGINLLIDDYDVTEIYPVPLTIWREQVLVGLPKELSTSSAGKAFSRLKDSMSKKHLIQITGEDVVIKNAGIDTFLSRTNGHT